MRKLVALVLLASAVAAAPDDKSATVFEKGGRPAAATQIDKAVFAALDKAGVRPARLCSDEVFVRRVYIDVIGTLPTAGEVKTFLDDKSADKRSKLIDRLLEREEFADYWAMRWCDVLRVKSEFPINLWPNAVQAYHRWIRTAVAENMPYDQFARALLTSSGSNFRVAPVNFYRAVQDRKPAGLAGAVALTFMGDRMESWPRDRRDGMELFFTRIGYKATGEWKEEIVLFDTESKAATEAVLPDGTKVKLAGDQDPRVVFADWLITDRNPWFARCIVNRVWFWLLGRGIIQEPDDIRPTNPPSNPELLALLEKELVAGKWDLKQLYRSILNSNTYQLSSVGESSDPKAAALFASYPIRRLDAEVLIDALCQITGTTEEYSSAIPEPFTWVPTDMRSIQLPDGSISSSFLELFGRPPRDTGMAMERNNTMTSAQRLHLLNSGHVRDKIEKGPALRAVSRQFQREPAKAIDELYLMVLSRHATDEEQESLKAFIAGAKSQRGSNSSVDVVWALINSTEFLYRH